MRKDEEWRDIPGIPYYQASNLGNIRSLSRTIRYPSGKVATYKGKVLAKSRGKAGYATTRIYDKTYPFYRLVALTFHGPPVPPNSVVRHLDGDPTNDNADNLRWGTVHENNMDQVTHGVHVSASKTRCKRGHLLAGENIRLNKRGGRVCRVCEQSRQQKERAADTEGFRALRRQRYLDNRENELAQCNAYKLRKKEESKE